MATLSRAVFLASVVVSALLPLGLAWAQSKSLEETLKDEKRKRFMESLSVVMPDVVAREPAASPPSGAQRCRLDALGTALKAYQWPSAPPAVSAVDITGSVSLAELRDSISIRSVSLRAVSDSHVQQSVAVSRLNAMRCASDSLRSRLRALTTGLDARYAWPHEILPARLQTQPIPPVSSVSTEASTTTVDTIFDPITGFEIQGMASAMELADEYKKFKLAPFSPIPQSTLLPPDENAWQWMIDYQSLAFGFNIQEPLGESPRWVGFAQSSGTCDRTNAQAEIIRKGSYEERACVKAAYNRAAQGGSLDTSKCNDLTALSPIGICLTRLGRGSGCTDDPSLFKLPYYAQPLDNVRNLRSNPDTSKAELASLQASQASLDTVMSDLNSTGQKVLADLDSKLDSGAKSAQVAMRYELARHETESQQIQEEKHSLGVLRHLIADLGRKHQESVAAVSKLESSVADISIKEKSNRAAMLRLARDLERAATNNASLEEKSRANSTMDEDGYQDRKSADDSMTSYSTILGKYWVTIDSSIALSFQKVEVEGQLASALAQKAAEKATLVGKQREFDTRTKTLSTREDLFADLRRGHAENIRTLEEVLEAQTASRILLGNSCKERLLKSTN